MTQDQICAIVERYRLALVPEWETKLKFLDYDDPESSENAAGVSRTDSYHLATISFYKGWENSWGASDAGLSMESTIVHEILHILFRDLDRTPYFLEGTLHPDIFRVFHNAYGHAREGAIERLALFIVRNIK